MLSTQQLCTAIDLIGRIRSSQDAPQVLERMHAAVCAFGATGAFHISSLPESDQACSTFALFACDPSFANHPAVRDRIREHPWFRVLSGRTAPLVDPRFPPQSQADAELMDLARQHGFTTCALIPTAAGGCDPLHVLCVGSATPGFFAEQEGVRVLLSRVLAAELRDWLTHHLGLSLQRQAGLRDGDLRLLHMEHRGLSTKEISRRTGFTPASIDSRFQRINLRLRCRTRRAAARRAAAYGLLPLDPGDAANDCISAPEA